MPSATDRMPPALPAARPAGSRRRALAVAAALAGVLHAALAASLLVDRPERTSPPHEGRAMPSTVALLVPTAPGPPAGATTPPTDHHPPAPDTGPAAASVAGATAEPRRPDASAATGASTIAEPGAPVAPGPAPREVGANAPQTTAPTASSEPDDSTAVEAADAAALAAAAPTQPAPATRPPAAEIAAAPTPARADGRSDLAGGSATDGGPAIGPSAGLGTATAAAPAPAPAPAVPVYPVRLPAGQTLAYDLTRGLFSGTGELRWEPAAGNRYQARLEGRIAGFLILQWTSHGGIERAGLAPVRFTDRRRGGAELAANFVRDQGVVRYSGPAVVHALPAGGQDRLSWMIQIAGIVQARPTSLAAGETLQLWVTGARGDADVWTFRSLGTVDVTAGGRTLRALALAREPREPHDTRVEVWLDPAREHLPVRARLGSARGDDALELVLRP